MANPIHDDDGPGLELADFEALFAEEDGVDQVLAAVSWLERADVRQRQGAGCARAMEETVRNAPLHLADELEALIRESVAARAEGDPDLAETATVEAWDLLVLRDRLEDLRPHAPELFDAGAGAALAAFDAALDRADVWLEELDDARLQMGTRQGKGDRRWWRPREDFGSGEWELPAEAHPDLWTPDEEEVAAWRRGELAPQRAAAVGRYFAGLEDVAADLRAVAAGTSGDATPTGTAPPVGVLHGEVQELEGGIEVRFMTLDTTLDTLRVDLGEDVAGVTLYTATGEQHTLVRHTARVWWAGDLRAAEFEGARLVAFKEDGAVFADVALGPLSDPAEE